MTEAQRIAQAVERHMKLPRGSVMRSTRGSPDMVLGRRIAWWLRKEQDPELTWTALGEEFGRHRSNISWSVFWLNEAIELYRPPYSTVMILRSQLGI